MSLASINRIAILKDRASLLAQARSFLAEKGVMEVDVPILSRAASVDVHIDLVQVTCCGKPAFLHSSPEYGMKRLLAEGIGDIYQISHVFRDHELGERHTIEFTMAEWYRIGFTLQQMLDETVEFIRLFLDDLPEKYTELSYRDAFMHYVGYYPSSAEERDALYAFEVEPHLGQHMLHIVTGFPAEQAALAQIGPDGLAQRFEIYFQGMELANGYHELIDSQEQHTRLIAANRERENLGKQRLPLDHDFVHALELGIPDCCGVAVGFDRLMMLRHRLQHIHDASCQFEKG